MAVALHSSFRVTVTRKRVHHGNVKTRIEEQMNRSVAQVVAAERSHTRDWPEAVVCVSGKPKGTVGGRLSVSAALLPAAMLEPRDDARSCERAT